MSTLREQIANEVIHYGGAYEGTEEERFEVADSVLMLFAVEREQQSARIAELEAENAELKAVLRVADTEVGGLKAERDAVRKALEPELNNIVSALWCLDNANAPIGAGDCRELASHIGGIVGRCRAALLAAAREGAALS